MRKELEEKLNNVNKKLEEYEISKHEFLNSLQEGDTFKDDSFNKTIYTVKSVDVTCGTMKATYKLYTGEDYLNNIYFDDIDYILLDKDELVLAVDL